MAMSPEDMEKRRQRRQAQLKKQRAQRRKLRLGLAAAVVVLGLCAFGIYYFVENTPQGEATVQSAIPETTASTTAPTEETSPVRESTTTIHLRAAGDLNVTDSVVDAGLAASGFDFTRAFQDVASTLSDADLTLLNLEGNIYGETYGTATTSAPYKLLTALRNAGVDLIQMANSCSINNGLIGLSSTLQAIRTAGMEPVGAYASPNEFRRSKGYTICEIQGLRVAFVAFTKGVGGRGMPAGNEDCVNLLYLDYDSTYKKVDTEGITQILSDVKAEKPDFTVALLHWGSENNDTISSTQESIVKLLQKNGVGLIIGTHPHLVQEIDYNESAGTLVAYSLGDFFGDAARGGTNYSIILDVEITKDNVKGTTRVTGYSYTPIYTVTKSQSADGFQRVVRIEQAMQAYDGNFVDKITKACYDDMAYSLTRIASRTSGKG
ncbi:MAG: CapA family protein [Firmicutes bacterium]|nr:CapA family protein [Bacillota bacterium]MDY6159768.1 CapA family protein [Candidatus Faecousia sp.]